jgi:hypothetical protein
VDQRDSHGSAGRQGRPLTASAESYSSARRTPESVRPLEALVQTRPDRVTIANPVELLLGIGLLLVVLATFLLLGKAFDALLRRTGP